MVLVYVSAILSLLLTLLAGIPYIDFLKKNLYGQYIREEAPTSHASKAGTPTTGGLIIIIPAIIGSILALVMDQKTGIDVFIVLLTFCLFTFLGFKDDIDKITKKQNKGLGARVKLLLQIFIAAIPAFYIYFKGETFISIFDITSINLGLMYPIFAILTIVGASNAVNLTDGLDGLASGTMFFALSALTLMCIMINRADLAIVSAAVAGSCLGFLYFNKHPARLFMGDTGSLALGGILAVIAVICKLELWLLLFGLIFVIEALSVIIQVISFKTTGKRVFKMSPIHHHFELSGLSETQVVSAFWIFAFITAILACTLKYILS